MCSKRGVPATNRATHALHLEPAGIPSGWRVRVVKPQNEDEPLLESLALRARHAMCATFTDT